MLDWLFPPACAGCEELGSRWCAACVSACERFPEGLCALCQQKIGAGVHICPRSDNLAWMASWGWHKDPLRLAVHRLKYKRDIALGEQLAQHLAVMLNAADLGKICVTPVPLWPGRQKQRGYNQAALLARPLAHTLGQPYYPDMVSRIRNTPSQIGLSASERRENVSGAFSAQPDKVDGRRVLLVDDVLTSGATLDAAAHALRSAGAVEVAAVTLARAL